MIGGVSIAIALLMAYEGRKTLSAESSPGFLLLYWSIFLFFLIIAMYVVLLDIRFIRMEYMMGRREIYHGTLGNEEFRRELLAQLNTTNNTSKTEDTQQDRSLNNS